MLRMYLLNREGAGARRRFLPVQVLPGVRFAAPGRCDGWPVSDRNVDCDYGRGLCVK